MESVVTLIRKNGSVAQESLGNPGIDHDAPMLQLQKPVSIVNGSIWLAATAYLLITVALPLTISHLVQSGG